MRNLGVKLSVAAVVIPLFVIWIANSLGWPSLAKAVLASAPREQAGAASEMFYTVYNVDRAFSQVLALMVIEFHVSPETVSRALSGIAKIQDRQMVAALVHSTNTGFRTFIFFFGVIILLILFLWHRYGKNRE